MEPFPPDPHAGPTSGGSSGGHDAGTANGPWRERCEVVAVLLVLAALGIVGQALFNALAFNEELSGNPLGSPVPSEWEIILPLVAQGGTLLSALPLVLALGLVVLAPGPLGRTGRLTLNLLSVVGVVVAALALLGVEETLRGRAGGPFSPLGAGDDSGGQAALFTKVGGVLSWIPPAALAGVTAWMAWRALNEDAATTDVDQLDTP